MKYFTLSELTKSSTAQRLGIKNEPTKEQADNLVRLVDNTLDKIREKYGKPIVVDSGFRCSKLNKAVGGSTSSQHMKGEAADIRSLNDDWEENYKILQTVLNNKEIPFDQMICEYPIKTKDGRLLPNWVHVSYSKDRQRRQVLVAKKSGGKTIYTNYPKM